MLANKFELIENCTMTSTLERVRRSVARQTSDIVLRRDLMRLGSSARVDAALGSLVRDQKLIRIGMGVYARTIELRGGERVLPRDFALIAEEALNRLGVKYELHPVIVEYRAGLTDQIPVRLVVAPRQRVARKLSVGRLSVKYVRNFRHSARQSSPGSVIR